MSPRSGPSRRFKRLGYKFQKMFLWWASTTLDLLCTTAQGSLPGRQPLERMGEIAARTLLKRLEDHGSWVPKIAIEPELAVRNRSVAQYNGQAPDIYRH